MKVERVKNLSEQDFINHYINGSKPIIITDGMDNWDVSKFSPDYLGEAFADSLVHVYDDLFDLKSVGTLASYLKKNFNRDSQENLTKEYIRWYAQLKDIDFFWSNDCFAELKQFWNHPYFVPKENLVVPFYEQGNERGVEDNGYPYKGIFISGKGNRTRLHKDPFISNAVLCQFYGSKEIYLYHPNKEASLMKDGEFVDLKNPDHTKFPDFSSIEPDYVDVLTPGEIILFPSGWFHDVTSIEDSISITWNFVHATQLDDLKKHIESYPNDDQLEILKYFLEGKVAADATSSELLAFYEKEFQIELA